jgi:Luciferase-like monooxygenase
MRFGLFGGAQAPRTPRGGAGRGFGEYIETNVEAERLGFYSTFLVEHHFSGSGQVSAPLDLLSWVAARTRSIRVGTAVLVLPWHDPVLLAERAATLDLLSEGRLDFGVERATGIRSSLASACRRRRLGRVAPARIDHLRPGAHRTPSASSDRPSPTLQPERSGDVLGRALPRTGQGPRLRRR